MNKLLILCGAMLLTACGAGEPAPAVHDENSLPPGIMQPIAGTGAVDGGFEQEIERQAMPTNMQ